MITPITPFSPPVVVDNKHDADRALASLAECKAELQLIDASLADAVARAKNIAAQEAAPILAKITILEKALETFAADNRGLIVTGKRKSLKLTCGSIGYKSKTDLRAKDWGEVTTALLDDGQVNFLLFKEPEADKKALAKLDDDELAGWGITREVTETFYAAPVVARVEDGEG